MYIERENTRITIKHDLCMFLPIFNSAATHECLYFLKASPPLIKTQNNFFVVDQT